MILWYCDLFIKIYLAAAIEFFSSNLRYLAHWSLGSQGRGKALEVQSYECWDLRAWCWWEEINFFKNFYFILARLHRTYFLFLQKAKPSIFVSQFDFSNRKIWENPFLILPNKYIFVQPRLHMEGKQTHGSFHNRTGLNNSILILDIRKGQIQDIVME